MKPIKPAKFVFSLVLVAASFMVLGFYVGVVHAAPTVGWTFNNNVAIAMKDSGGTARNILSLDASNIVQVGGTGATTIQVNNALIFGAAVADSSSAGKFFLSSTTANTLKYYDSAGTPALHVLAALDLSQTFTATTSTINNLVFGGTVNANSQNIYGISGLALSTTSGDASAGGITGPRVSAFQLISASDGAVARSLQIATQNGVTAGTGNGVIRMTFNAGSAAGTPGIQTFESIYFGGATNSMTNFNSQTVIGADAAGGNFVFNVPTAKSFLFQVQGSTKFAIAASGITTLAGIATAGVGVPGIFAATSQRSETAADTNVLTYTPPATAGNYRVCFTAAVSAQNTATLGWTATWTDSNGVAQAPTNIAMQASGVAAPFLTRVVSTNDVLYGCTTIDINNAAANIVVKLTFSGTSFTAKVTATIEQLA